MFAILEQTSVRNVLIERENVSALVQMSATQICATLVIGAIIDCYLGRPERPQCLTKQYFLAFAARFQIPWASIKYIA